MFVGLWVIYGFTIRQEPLRSTDTMGPVPFPAWVSGLRKQLEHGFREGPANYLFGRISNSGWWSFYLACIAVKTTIGAQALAVLRRLALVRRPPAASSVWVDVALLSFPTLLLVVMSASRHLGGICFLLPAFPFVLLWVGRVWGDPHRTFAGSGPRSVCRSSRRARTRGWLAIRTT